MDGDQGQPGTADDNQAECSKDSFKDEPEFDDTELAAALGVPDECIKKMTPKKGSPPRVPENIEPMAKLAIPTNSGDQKRVALTKDQRDQRIEELKFLGCALSFLFSRIRLSKLVCRIEVGVVFNQLRCHSQGCVGKAS